MSDIANETDFPPADEANSVDQEAAVCISGEGSSHQHVPCDPSDSALDNFGNDEIHSFEIIANGIASLLGPVMRSYNAGVDGALKSQNVLASSIDRLTRELDKLLEDAPIPHITQYATRLSKARKKVTSLNTRLQVIQKRIDYIERSLSRHGPGVVQKNKQESSPVPAMMKKLNPVAKIQPLLGLSHAQTPSIDPSSTIKDNTNANHQSAADVIHDQSSDSHFNDHVLDESAPTGIEYNGKVEDPTSEGSQTQTSNTVL